MSITSNNHFTKRLLNNALNITSIWLRNVWRLNMHNIQTQHQPLNIHQWKQWFELYHYSAWEAPQWVFKQILSDGLALKEHGSWRLIDLFDVVKAVDCVGFNQSLVNLMLHNQSIYRQNNHTGWCDDRVNQHLTVYRCLVLNNTESTYTVYSTASFIQLLAMNVKFNLLYHRFPI